MKLSTRELVIVAVFGTLWGIAEMSLGTVLKSLNIPMSGLVLSTIGLTVAMIGRVFVPKRGATLFVGVIAMLLKLFSLGGVVLGPMIGIISEALLAELVLSLGGKPRRALFVIAGAVGTLWPLIQPFITGPLLFGQSLFTTWLNLLDTGSRLMGIGTDAIFVILLGMIAVHLLIGIVAGVIAWDLGRLLQIRMDGSYREAYQ
ncbi:MAG: hypothetical protein R3E31_19575 [Chloroflexota bacterium]|nr:hypothetical protein [Anaerolineales bacterium]MCB8965913.1 hypothetical protein [Ardenticatenaceae bacterium]